MKPLIPYGKQSISDDDIQVVVDILKSDWLTQGPVIDQFENACANYCGAEYAIAVNSATSALHLACMAMDLGPGDILWTTPITFVASSNCALYCGAKVDFVDIDKKTYNLCPQLLEQKLIAAKKTNSLPKVLVAVHFAGQSCEMKPIRKLADEYGFKIIEDASHAIGGKYEDQTIGSCQYSDLAIFSFHPVKIITTGEGGMVVTNNENLGTRIRLLRSHGVTRDEKLMLGQTQGAWYYQQVALGYNYRLTDIQAGLGLSQLRRIDTFVSQRHFLAAQYDEALKNLPVVTPWQSPHCYSAYHLYPIQLKLESITLSRKQVFDELRQAGIGVNVHYIPVHTQPYYEKFGFKSGDFPIAEAYYERAISLPLFYSMSIEEQDYVVATLQSFLSR